MSHLNVFTTEIGFKKAYKRLMFLVLVSYIYVGTGGFKSRNFPNEYFRNWYKDLSVAFLSGHLDLGTIENPEIKKSDGWDLSLYKGKYYMYFGVTPVLTAYLPIRILTFGKIKMTGAWCVILFTFGVFALGSALMLKLKQRFFANGSNIVFFLSMVGFAYTNFVFLQIRRPVMYQEAITSAVFFMMLGLFLLVRFVETEKSKFLVFSGAALALSVGGRPTEVFPTIVVLGLTTAYLKDKFKQSPILLVKLYSPYFMGIAALLLYNYLRFESFTEFGWHYQITSIKTADTPVFAFDRILPGMFFHSLQWPYFFGEFPFLHVKTQPSFFYPLPKLYGLESPIGIFAYSPQALLIFPGLIFLYKKHLPAFKVVATLAIIGLCSLFFVSSFVTVIDRFSYEFGAIFVFAFSLFWIAIDGALKDQAKSVRLVNAIIGVLFLYSMYVHIFAIHLRWDCCKDGA